MRAPAFWGFAPTRFSPLATALAPLSWIYDIGHRIRWRVARTERAPVPVVCIGNLVAGGAGKTPTALAIAQHLLGKGLAVHFVTRGYGGALVGPVQVDSARHDAAQVGDEALLLAAIAPTWVARDRAAGAHAAAAAGAAAVVLDDGFQNPRLAKDLSLVVVDGTYGFGNGRVLPAGPLRETPGRGLDRADAVVLIGTQEAVTFPAGPPVLYARLMPTDESRARLAGARVVAFAGIGAPSKSFDMLEGLGCTLVAARAFADHHRYRPAELVALRNLALRSGARLVTTTKDLVRIPAAERTDIEVLEVVLQFLDPALLDRVLAPMLRP